MKCYNYACRKDSDQLIEVGYGGYRLCQSCANVHKHEKEMETRWLERLEFFAQHFQRMMIPVEGDHPVVRREKLMNFYRFNRDWSQREKLLRGFNL